MKTKYVIVEVGERFKPTKCLDCPIDSCVSITPMVCFMSTAKPAVKVDNSLSRAIGDGEVFIVKNTKE